MSASVAPGGVRLERLPDLDPELAAAVEAASPGIAARVRLPAADLPAGPFDPAALLPGCHAVLVVDGLVVRQHHLEGMSSAELLGPGELGGTEEPDALLATATVWTAAQPTAVALLGPATDGLLRAVPALAAVLLERAATRDAASAALRALTALPRVEQRVLALLAHLAARFGRMTPEGVVVPLHLTHRTLGQLVGAARPTVTLALQSLEEEGRLLRRSDRTWVLAGLPGRAGDGAPPRAWAQVEAMTAPPGAREAPRVPAGFGPEDARLLLDVAARTHRDARRQIDRGAALRERVEATRHAIERRRTASSAHRGPAAREASEA